MKGEGKREENNRDSKIFDNIKFFVGLHDTILYM